MSIDVVPLIVLPIAFVLFVIALIRLFPQLQQEARADAATIRAMQANPPVPGPAPTTLEQPHA